MSLAGSNKRSGVPESSGDGSRLRIPTNDNDIITGFDDVPAECNVRILQFLDVDELANIAQVSHRFHENSLDPSLPQNRTATLACVRRWDESTGTFSASPLLLMQKLIDKAVLDQCWRFTKIKIVGHNLLENITIPEVRDMLPNTRMLHHVRVLDLSFPSNAVQRDTNFKDCVPALLASAMPCLVEIDLSNAGVTESALGYFAYECPGLEKVTWNNHHANTQMSGEALIDCEHLTEIYMDDSVFTYDVGESPLILALTGQWVSYSIFCDCSTNLVRVSLKNAKCREPRAFLSPGPAETFPQIGLVKFVRNTPSLRWFGSDLSPENVAILRAERPEVTYV
jgi:hypothetical protein